MLEKTILANSIYSALQSDSSVESYMSKIKEHLESATIMVNYVGVVPSVPPIPDPLSGPYSLQVQTVPTFVQGSLIKALLSSLQEANPQLFVDTIINSLTSHLS